jgi:hypothetical protein
MVDTWVSQPALIPYSTMQPSLGLISTLSLQEV